MGKQGVDPSDTALKKPHVQKLLTLLALVVELTTLPRFRTLVTFHVVRSEQVLPGSEIIR